MTGSRWYRAAVLAVAVLPAVAVAPGQAFAAAGNAKAYALISQSQGKGLVARWNPCAGPIDYRVNPAGAPANSLPEVKAAVARIGAASGLVFRYAGTTSAVPRAAKGWNGKYPAGTEIVLAWVSPGRQSTMLPASSPKTTAGMGGASWVTAYTATGGPGLMMLQGQVVLNQSLAAKMPRGFDAKPGGTTGQLIMHELGHAIGLAHPAIADPHEVMYPTMTTKKAVWGPGDLTGLKKVGRSAGCLYARNPQA